MLINFFKNIFPVIEVKTKDKDPMSVLYQQLNALVIKHKDEEICLNAIKKHVKEVSSELLNNSLEKAIVENNLSLLKIIFPYLRKVSDDYEYNYHNDSKKYGTNKSEFKDPHKSEYYYAKLAMQNNRIDVFDYFINYSNQFSKTYSYEYSPQRYFRQNDAKSSLIENLVRDEKLDYLKITQYYSLFKPEKYLQEHLDYFEDDFDYTILIGEQELNFVLDNFCIPKTSNYNHNYYTDFLSGLLFSLTKYEEKQEPHLNIIKNLLNRGANFSYVNIYQKNQIFALNEERSFTLANLLIKEGYKDIDNLALKFAQIEQNFSTIQFLFENGANINIRQHKVHKSLYEFIKKRADIKELFIDLSDEMIVNNKAQIKSKKNKL